MKDFRVGIIGAGGIARGAHAPGWKRVPGAVMAAVADIDPEAARSFAREHDIPGVFTDYRELLELDLDAVDICTPNRVHTPAVLAALASGKHVLCEKPLATTAAEVRAMGEAADRAGLVLMTAQHQRFTPQAVAIKEWAAQGNLGEVYHARVKAMRRALLPTAPGFIDMSLSGGGPCMDIGVHALDLCLWLMGFPRAARVTGSARVNFAKGWDIPGMWGEWDRARFSVEDFASGFVHFDGGATLTLETSWLGHQQENEEMGCQLFGLKGGVKWPSGEIAGVAGKALVQGTLACPWRLAPAHSEEIWAFHDAVVNGKPSPVPWRETLQVIAILEAIYASQREGREIRLEA